MNRRRRLSACRSFSMETLEPRSMLAADSVEGSFAVEAADLSDEVAQDEVFQESPTDACSLPCDTSEDSPLPFQVVPMDDTANSLPVSGEAEPVTEPEEPFIGMDFGTDDGQALEASFSLLVCPPVSQFETTGLIAFEPEVSVDPVLTSDVTTGVSHLQFIDGDIWNSWTFVESGLHLTSEIVDLPTNFGTNLGMDADTITVVDDSSLFWCEVGVPTDSGDVDIVAAPVESPAADSTSDDEAPVVASSSGGSSPSPATAQAFAAFSASFGQGTSYGQGGGDVQPGLPIVGGRRTARRSMR